MTSSTCYHDRVRWALLILLAAATAEAGPQVEIRAHTQLSFTGAQKREGGMIEVTGKLTDKLTGDGIGSERIYVTIGDQTVPAFTSPDGSFHILTPASDGPIELTLAYKGGSRLEQADPVKVTTDPAKVQTRLEIVKTVDDPAGTRIKINASSPDESGLDLPVRLEVGPVEEDAFKPLRTVTSGTDITLTRTEAGGAGVHRLRAIFDGDATRQPSTATVTLELTSGTTTTIAVSAKQLAYEDDLVVTGHVMDDDHHPVARAAVTLMAGEQRLAQGATSADGKYRFTVEAEIIVETQERASAQLQGGSTAGAGVRPSLEHSGSFGIQVKADPDSSSVRPSHSDPIIVTIKPPQPVPVSYTIIAFVATLGAAGGFFAARTKPWRRLRRPAPPAEVPSEERESEQVKGGLVVAKPGVVATLRRPNDEGFSGVVRDTVRGRPIADAVVTVVLGQRVTETGTPVPNERSTRTAADGSFSIEKLESGEWRAEVAAPGHVTEMFTLTIPHRGELRGVRVDLVPVRERVFQLYRRAAEPVLPESRLWGVWSPRQIVDHVRTKRPSPALADLTDFVEEVYFSPRLAAETILPEASKRVDRAIGERAARR
jgi:hypothetical protein